MTRLNLPFPTPAPEATQEADAIDALTTCLEQKKRDLRQARAELAEARHEYLRCRAWAHAWKAAARNEYADRLAGQVLAAEMVEALAHLLPLPERAAILAHLSVSNDPPHKTDYQIVREVVGELALFLPRYDRARVLEILYPEGRE